MAEVASRFVTFSGLGAIGTLLHFLVLGIAVSGMGLSPVAGSSLGALAGALTNYLLNYHVNYRSRERHRVALPRFLLIAATGFVLNGLLMGELTAAAWHLNYLVAQIVTSVTVLLWNFSANHLWTFRPRAG